MTELHIFRLQPILLHERVENKVQVDRTIGAILEAYSAEAGRKRRNSLFSKSTLF